MGSPLRQGVGRRPIIIYERLVMRSAPLGTAGVAEQGHLGKKPKAGFELSLKQKKRGAGPSEKKPAAIVVVRVIWWFISVPEGFRLG